MRSNSSSGRSDLIYILAMTRPDFTDHDLSDLAALVRDAIEAEPYRAGPRIAKLKRLLSKLEPATEPEPTPFPAPRPSGEPSLLYRKSRSGRRR